MAVVLNNGLNTMNRVYDKTKNNLTYGTAFGLAGASYLAVKGRPEAMKYIGKGIGYAGKGAYKLGGKVATKLGVAKQCVAVKNVLVSGAKKVGGAFTYVKNSAVGKAVVDGAKTVGNAIGKVLPKLPNKGILGAVAVGLGALMIVLSHKHGYNAGKIDQAYADRRQAINGFQI